MEDTHQLDNDTQEDMELDNTESTVTSPEVRKPKQKFAHHPLMMAQRSLSKMSSPRLKQRAGFRAKSDQQNIGQRGEVLKYLVKQESKSAGAKYLPSR